MKALRINQRPLNMSLIVELCKYQNKLQFWNTLNQKPCDYHSIHVVTWIEFEPSENKILMLNLSTA